MVNTFPCGNNIAKSAGLKGEGEKKTDFTLLSHSFKVIYLNNMARKNIVRTMNHGLGKADYT